MITTRVVKVQYIAICDLCSKRRKGTASSFHRARHNIKQYGWLVFQGTNGLTVCPDCINTHGAEMAQVKAAKARREQKEK